MQAGSLCYKQSHTKKPKTEFFSKHNSTPDDAAREWWWLWSLQHHSTKLMIYAEWLLFYRLRRVPMQWHLYLQQIRCDLWSNRVRQAPKTKKQHHAMSGLWCTNTCADKHIPSLTGNTCFSIQDKTAKTAWFHCELQVSQNFTAATNHREIFYLYEKHVPRKHSLLCKLWIRIKPYVSTTMYALCQLHVPLC